MKLLQVNVDRGKQAMDLLLHNCLAHRVDLALIAEPNIHMANNSPAWITDERVDAAIYIPPNGLKIRNSGKGHGYVWVETFGMLVYSCYVSPTLNENELYQFLLSLSNDIDLRGYKRTEVLIGGDFNAKALCWGSPIEDKKGATLAEWIHAHDYILLNDGRVPTFERQNGSSYIDITMCSVTVGKLISRWYVADEENLSFHKNIYIELLDHSITSTQRGNRHKNGWIYNEESSAALLRYFQTDIGHYDYLNQPSALVTAIVNACNFALKPKSGGWKHKAVYWWNSEIAQLRRQATQARRKLTRLHRKRATIPDLEMQEAQLQYRQSRHVLKTAIKTAKQRAWDALCASVDADIWGTGYKIVTGKIGARPQLHLTDDEQLQIATTLFPTHSISVWPPIEVNEGDIPVCETQELLDAVHRIKPGKAAGPDALSPDIIKVIAAGNPDIFVNVLSRLMVKGIFPRDWKTAQLILLEKPKKGDGSISYRPICLLNVIGKLFEQIINKRLVDEIGKGEGFAARQFGFRKGLSTLDALQTIATTLKGELTGIPKPFAAMVTLDVKNAFNSAPWKGIIMELKRRSVAPYLIRLLCSYLEARQLLIGDRKRLDMSCGIPQGSVLGPTLWNIYYDGVLKLVLPSGVHTIGYADDLALLAFGTTVHAVEEKLTWSVNRIAIWMMQRGLTLAPEKTEIVILEGRRTFKDLHIAFCGQVIRSTKQVKYLGVQLGHNMNMYAHLKYVTGKAEKAAAALGRLMPNIGGPKPEKRKVLASVVNSILLYCAAFWYGCLEKPTCRRLVERAQRKILIRVVSAYRTVSTRALQVLAGAIPIHLLARESQYAQNIFTVGEKRLVRAGTLVEWQTEWDAEFTVAQWTKRLLPHIKPWIHRPHGAVDFHLTQFLSGHGNFRSYLFKMGLAASDACQYCGDRDTPEHTILICQKWSEIRQRCASKLGLELTTINILPKMLDSQQNWNIIHDMVISILKAKKRDAHP